MAEKTAHQQHQDNWAQHRYDVHYTLSEIKRISTRAQRQYDKSGTFTNTLKVDVEYLRKLADKLDLLQHNPPVMGREYNG